MQNDNKESSFPKRLKEGLKLRNMTQADLARKTGLWPSAISSYVKGEYDAKQDNLDLIATALISYLVDIRDIK